VNEQIFYHTDITELQNRSRGRGRLRVKAETPPKLCLW